MNVQIRSNLPGLLIPGKHPRCDKPNPLKFNSTSNGSHSRGLPCLGKSRKRWRAIKNQRSVAKGLIELLLRIAPEWRAGFYRFESGASRSGSTASYATDTKTVIVDPFANAQFHAVMNKIAAQVLQVLSRECGVILVSVDPQYTFDVQFDFENLNRWRITKIGGGTGIPEGIDLP